MHRLKNKLYYTVHITDASGAIEDTTIWKSLLQVHYEPDITV